MPNLDYPEPTGDDAIDYAAVVQMFVAESEEGLRSMEEAILVLESRPEEDEALQTIFRVVHTLKGNASSLGLRDLADFSHALEDVLDRLRTHAMPVHEEVISLLLEAADALSDMIAVIRTRE